LHWANPIGMRDMRPDPANTAYWSHPYLQGPNGSYTGPVPMVTHVHGAHTYEDSDGYPEAWYLPVQAAMDPNIAFTTGTFFDLFNDKYGLLNFILFGSDTGAYTAWLAHPATAFAAIVVADVWKTSSFAGLLILAGLQIIPDELYEASRIDGASAWQQFRRITLPLVKPALLIALLFRTMDAFRVFDLVFVMTQGGPADSTNVLQFYGYKKIFTEGMMGYGSTISVLVFFITFVVSLFYIRVIGTRLFQEKI